MVTLTVVVHPLHPPGFFELVQETPGVEVILADDEDGVVSVLEEGAVGLVTYRWDPSFLTEALRWVQSLSAGIEQFPVDELRRCDVVLTSARGVHSPAVAEHAIALLLAAMRGVGGAMRDTAERRWTWGRPAFEVGGSTLGVLGLGHVGEQVAVLARGLGMRVIGTKANPDGYRGVAERVLGPDGTAEVCADADAVVVALPDDASDGPVIGAPELEALGRGVLVNVGRGSAVDEQALVEALRSGRLRAAGLDVFQTEPLPPGSPLWDIENVVITPHAAWSSDRLPGRMAERFRHNAAVFAAGGDGWEDRRA